MRASTLPEADAPNTVIIDTSAMPIMRADAVAAVRRGLRRLFSAASCATMPERGRATAAIERTTGRASTGVAEIVPNSMSTMPATNTQIEVSAASFQAARAAPTTKTRAPTTAWSVLWLAFSVAM